jgi:hypothetical protein
MRGECKPGGIHGHERAHIGNENLTLIRKIGQTRHHNAARKGDGNPFAVG